MPKVHQYFTGSMIYARGDDAGKLFILQSGKVSLAALDIETGIETHEMVSPGEFFGVKSALGHFPREENAMAVANSAAMVFTVPEFEAFAMSNPKIIIKMLKVFSTQMRRVHRQIAKLKKRKEVDPDEGLFGIGEKYLKLKRYAHAKYIFSRYLSLYPSGAKAVLAVKNLQLAEKGIVKTAAKSQQKETAEEYREAAGSVSKQDTDQDPGGFSRFTRIFRSDEIIFSEYEPGETFYLIQSGRVKLLKNEGESERSLDILQPPEMFGEMAILEGSPRSATAIALDEVKALEFNAQNFEIIMTGNPQIGINLLRIFAKRIFDSKRRFMILILPTIQLKVLDVFLMLDETLPDIDRETETREFQATVEDIAHWAGVTATEAREVLQSFVIQKRLEIYATRIVVKNINDFARTVNSRRRQAMNPTGLKT